MKVLIVEKSVQQH